MIKVKKFSFNSFEEHCHLVWVDGCGKACAVIDPGFDGEEEYDALKKAVTENRLSPAAALLTHSHPDHVYGVHRLCEEFDIPVYMNEGEELTLRALPAMCRNMGHADVEDFSARVRRIEDGDRIFITEGGTGSGLEFKALLTPGHSAGGVCYLCREFRHKDGRKESLSSSPASETTAAAEKENPRVTIVSGDSKTGEAEDKWKILFSGDTLFAGCIGRSDLPGGDYTALMQSIFTRLLPLEGDIDVLPGHGPSTTIADERTKNPFLQPFNEPCED